MTQWCSANYAGKINRLQLINVKGDQHSFLEAKRRLLHGEKRESYEDNKKEKRPRKKSSGHLEGNYKT